MAFAKGDEVVEALTANRADEALTVCVRLWAADWGFQGAHAETGQGSMEVCREHGAVVVKDEAVGMAAGERFAELLEGPLGGGMRGDVGVQQAALSYLHGDEHVKHAETGGHHGEEIAGDDGLGVVADKGVPALRGRSAWAAQVAQVAAHGSWRDLDAQLQGQFIGDAMFAPGGVVVRHLADEGLEVLGQRRTASPTRFPAP